MFVLGWERNCGGDIRYKGLSTTVSDVCYPNAIADKSVGRPKFPNHVTADGSTVNCTENVARRFEL